MSRLSETQIETISKAIDSLVLLRKAIAEGSAIHGDLVREARWRTHSAELLCFELAIFHSKGGRI